MQLRYFAGLALGLSLCFTAGSAASRFPDPAQDVKPGSAGSQQTAVLAGGCFWGVEAVFERLEGVSTPRRDSRWQATTAHYEVVSTGTTGHAETVKIVDDPAKISYEQLLKVFFAVAHDPTQLNRRARPRPEGPLYDFLRDARREGRR